MIVEECDGELRLKPAAVLGMDCYSDTEIEEWDQSDALPPCELQAILHRLQQA